MKSMKRGRQNYIVYASYRISLDNIITAYSPAEAEYIMVRRLEKRGRAEPKVDGVMTTEKERGFNEVRDQDA